MHLSSHCTGSVVCIKNSATSQSLTRFIAFLTDLCPQLDPAAVLWRIDVLCLVFCLHCTDGHTWAIDFRIRLLPTQRFFYTIWNRDMWSVQSLKEFHPMLTFRLRRPGHRNSQRHASVQPVSTCNYGWSTTLSPLCLCWSIFCPHANGKSRICQFKL